MSFPTSRDYDLLLRLMPTHRLVCFVDYRFPSDSRDEPPCRDVCRTRYEGPDPQGRQEYSKHPYFAAQSRGICYAGGRRMTPEDFKKDCAAVNLEFILPPSAVNSVTPVNPVTTAPLKLHGDPLTLS